MLRVRGMQGLLATWLLAFDDSMKALAAAELGFGSEIYSDHTRTRKTMMETVRTTWELSAEHATILSLFSFLCGACVHSITGLKQVFLAHFPSPHVSCACDLHTARALREEDHCAARSVPTVLMKGRVWFRQHCKPPSSAAP